MLFAFLLRADWDLWHYLHILSSSPYQGSLARIACILDIDSFGIVSVYEPNTRFVLEGYEVWHNGRCEMRFQPTEGSRAALAIEDAMYQYLEFHLHI